MMRRNSSLWRSLRSSSRHRCILAVSAIVGMAHSGVVGEEIEGVVSKEMQAAGDPLMVYHEIVVGEPKPKAERGLIVVLPGGDGSSAFNPFVQRLAKFAIGRGYVVAQLVAPKWRDGQKTVWPTSINRVPGMKFTTEQFVETVVAEVSAEKKIAPDRVFTLSWSSGGPAAYVAALSEETPIRGSYIAMAVFRERWCPPLRNAKGRAFFIDHSPDDEVCEFDSAKLAEKVLQENGAKIKLVTYEGGHGWHGDSFGRVRQGVAWLEDASR